MSYFQRRILGALIPVNRLLRAKETQTNQHAEAQPELACRKHRVLVISAILSHPFLYGTQISCCGLYTKLFVHLLPPVSKYTFGKSFRELIFLLNESEKLIPFYIFSCDFFYVKYKS